MNTTKEERYHNLLRDVWAREISADEAMEQLQDLINCVKQFRNAAIDCINYGETDALEMAIWNSRDFSEGDE